MTCTGKLEHEDIRAAVARVVASADFEKSDRLVRFLQYLVDQYIDGQSSRLKGYTIGIDVFDRGVSFDPNKNAIVRVEAGRLRQKLEHYYLTTGKDDQVVIEIPSGTYVPEFHNNGSPDKEFPVPAGKAGGNTATVVSPQPTWKQSVWILSIASVISTIMFLSFVSVDRITHWLGNRSIISPALDETAAIPDGVSIAVFQFRDLSVYKGNRFLTSCLTNRIIDELTSFKSVSIYAPDIIYSGHAFEQNASKDQPEIMARYVLHGYIRRSGNRLETSVMLMVSNTRQVLWAGNFTLKATSADLGDINKKIARQIATAISRLLVLSVAT